jgi:hypothetical protein
MGSERMSPLRVERKPEWPVCTGGEEVDFGSNEQAAQQSPRVFGPVATPLLDEAAGQSDRFEFDLGKWGPFQGPRVKSRVDKTEGGWMTRAEGSVSTGEIEKGGFKVGGPSIGYGYRGGNGEYGAGFSASSVAVEYSSQELSKDSKNDRKLTAGLSAGPSAELYAGRRDEDGDGEDEYCGRVSGGPATLEYCTESPGTDVAVTAALGPINALNYVFLDKLLPSISMESIIGYPKYIPEDPFPFCEEEEQVCRPDFWDTWLEDIDKLPEEPEEEALCR